MQRLTSTARKWAMQLAAILAVAPFIVSWLLKTIIWPRPFWIFHYDPETIYFYSGLSLLRGRMPPNVDNPGTPLQMLSAAMAALTGATPLRYEQFLGSAHLLGLMFSMAGALTIFYGVMAGAPPLLRVAAVWSYCIAPAALERLNIWSPEIMYLPIGACVLALFRSWLESSSRGKAIALGMLVGFGIAGKFAWLIWAPALVLAILSAGHVLHASLAAAGVGVGFVIGTIPVAAEYGTMFRRLWYLSGSGHADQTWSVLLRSSTVWQAFLGFGVLFSAWHFRRSRLPWAVLAAALLAFGILGAARNPTFRYLLPSAFAVVALLALVSSSDKLTNRAQVAVLTITAGLLFKTFGDDVRAHRERIAEGRALRTEIARVLPRDATVIYGWRVPVPSFALRVMSSDPQDMRDISRLYPREGHLNPWNGELVLPAGAHRWDYLVVGDDDLRQFPAGTYEIVTHIHGYAVARSSPVVVTPVP